MATATGLLLGFVVFFYLGKESFETPSGRCLVATLRMMQVTKERSAIVRRNHLRFNLWFGKTIGALNVDLQCARHRDRPLIRYISDSKMRRSLLFPLIFKIIHGTIL